MTRDGTLSPGRVLEGGILAGLAFAIFEVVAAIVLTGPAHAFVPLRMIAAMVLGPHAMDPGYSLAAAASVGLLLHLILSMIFAAIFAALIPGTFATRSEIELGMFYGLMLWLANFHLIGPALGWVWFAQQPMPMPLAQLTAHTVAYGAVLGWFQHHAWVVDDAGVDEDLREFHALN